MKCRICDNEDLKKFLSFGETPLANAFLSEKELGEKESTFPLEACFCTNCSLIQLTQVVPPEMMFKDYLYLSSATNTFKNHFTDFADEISKNFNLNEKSLVVDIGGNDGLLLNCFKKVGMQTIDIEPASNIALIAEQNGIETINKFFDGSAVEEVIKKKGNADLVTATNVFAHVDDVQQFVRDVKHMLKENGVFIIEVPYLLDMLENLKFDTIYHEHLSYFSASPLVTLFEKFRMEIFDIEKVKSQGVSLRIFIKNKEGKHPVSEKVAQILENEKKIGIDKLETYGKLADKIYDLKAALVKFLDNIKKQGKSIAGYGAPAKGNTLLNFCNIGKNYLDYIVEDNSLKQNLFTPGTHIPVVSRKTLDEQTPDYILILAWNFAQEILGKTKKYSENGVKFIIPLPEPHIVNQKS